MGRDPSKSTLVTITNSVYRLVFSGIECQSSPILPLISDKKLFVVSREKFYGFLTYSLEYGESNAYYIYDVIKESSKLHVGDIDDMVEFGESLLNRTKHLKFHRLKASHENVVRQKSKAVFNDKLPRPKNFAHPCDRINPKILEVSSKVLNVLNIFFDGSNTCDSCYDIWTAQQYVPSCVYEKVAELSFNDIAEFVKLVKSVEKEKIKKLGDISKEAYYIFREIFEIEVSGDADSAKGTFYKKRDMMLSWFVLEFGRNIEEFRATITSHIDMRATILPLLYYYPKSVLNALKSLIMSIEQFYYSKQFKQKVHDEYYGRVTLLEELLGGLL